MVKIRQLISQIKQRITINFGQSKLLEVQSSDQKSILYALESLANIYTNRDAGFNLKKPFYPENIEFTSKWKAMLNSLAGNQFIPQLQQIGQVEMYLAQERQEQIEDQEDENQLKQIRSNLRNIYSEYKTILLRIPNEADRIKALLQRNIKEEEAEIYLDCFENPTYKNILLNMFPKLRNRIDVSFNTLDELACHLLDMTEENKLAYVETIKDENWKTILQTQEALDCLLACFEDPNIPFLRALQFNFSHLKATVSQIGLNGMQSSISETTNQQDTPQRQHQPGQ